MKKTMRGLLLSVPILVVLLSTPSVVTYSYAELPPGSYERLKANAQEKLKVRITQVHQKEKSKRKLEVTFNAEVIEVKRSNSGLKPGDTIIIHSYRWTGRYAGPKNPPLLPVGWVGTAYLNRLENSPEEAGNNYSLAAYGASFE